MPPEADHPESSAGERFGRESDENGSSAAPDAALRDAVERLGELKEYASYYAAAKLDGYKAMGRNIGIYAALGLVGAVAACVLVGAAVALLLGGIAQGVGTLAEHWFGPGWNWLGPFVVGLIVLGGFAAGAVFGMKWLSKRARAGLTAKYEDRQRRQRVKYGHDVEQRAREAKHESSR